MSTVSLGPTASTAPHTLPPLLIVLRNELYAYLRNRMAVFWVFVFPLLIFVSLGFAVGTDLGSLELRVTDLDRSPASRALTQRLTATLSSSRLVRARVSVDGVPVTATPAAGPAAPSPAARSVLDLVIPAGFGVAVASSAGAPPLALHYQTRYSAPVYVAVQSIERTAGEFALAARGIEARAAVIGTGALDGAGPPRFDQFLFAGVIVLMLMSGGLLSLSLSLAGQREQNMFRYYAVWPLAPGSYLGGVIAARVGVMLAALALFLLLGQLLFGLRFQVDALRLSGVLVLGLLGGLMFSAIGFLLAAVTRTVASAELAGNLLYYPMLLLGNITIPLRELPFGADRVMQWLPSAQLAVGMRKLLFGDGPAQWPLALMASIAAGTALLFLIGSTCFRFQTKAVS